MTPKEKAKELFEKFYLVREINEVCILSNYSAKQCALIAVDEIIESYKTKNLIYPKEIIYYEEVKQEIKKL